MILMERRASPRLIGKPRASGDDPVLGEGVGASPE